MRDFSSPGFWAAYTKLPEQVRKLADRNYALLKEDPQHPSLHLKKVGRFWSVRVGLRYRALAIEAKDGLSLVLDRVPPGLRCDNPLIEGAADACHSPAQRPGDRVGPRDPPRAQPRLHRLGAGLGRRPLRRDPRRGLPVQPSGRLARRPRDLPRPGGAA